MLTDEHLALRDMVREFAQRHVAPRAAEIDEAEAYPFDIKDLLAEQQLLAMGLPEEYGGLGEDQLAVSVIVEQLAMVCASTASIIATQLLGAGPLLVAGSAEQKARWLPGIAAGAILTAVAMTEPEAGSDLSGMRTRAERDADGYVLTGGKRFISAGNVADLITVFAKTDPEAGSRGISAFLVPKDAQGLSVPRQEHKMGVRGHPACEVLLDGVRLSAASRVGAEGEGMKIMFGTLDKGRVTVAALATGIAQGALEYAVAYGRERIQFGQPVMGFQGLQFEVADMATKIEAARQLTYRAALAINRKEPERTRLAAMAKLFATETAMEVTTNAVQWMGGHGYIKDHPVERMMRDAKFFQIGEGTNQIQRIVIARHVIKLGR